MKRLDSIWQCLVAFFLTRISTTTATVAWSSLSGPVSPLCHISLGNVWRVIPMSRLELGMYGGVFWRETSQESDRNARLETVWQGVGCPLPSPSLSPDVIAMPDSDAVQR
eukprot:3364382-Rhodomonas_salina.4